jgi:hypothetical protein
MTIIDTDVISATSAVDDKKIIGIDLSDSLFGNKKKKKIRTN